LFSTELLLTPNISEWRLAEGDEVFFSFMFLNIPAMNEHAIQGEVLKFAKDGHPPQQESIDIANAPIESFPKHNSTKERGYALAKFFSTTETGERTLELFFRATWAVSMRYFTSMEFRIEVITPGSDIMPSSRRNKTFTIALGHQDQSGVNSYSSINTVPCSANVAGRGNLHLSISFTALLIFYVSV